MDDEDSTYDDSTSNMPSDLYPLDLGEEEILASESATGVMEVYCIYNLLIYMCICVYILVWHIL